ncbi:hypothetical protein ACLKA7_010674 [Drosophila subpalustris]
MIDLGQPMRARNPVLFLIWCPAIHPYICAVNLKAVSLAEEVAMDLEVTEVAMDLEVTEVVLDLTVDPSMMIGGLVRKDRTVVEAGMARVKDEEVGAEVRARGKDMTEVRDNSRTVVVVMGANVRAVGVAEVRVKKETVVQAKDRDRNRIKVVGEVMGTRARGKVLVVEAAVALVRIKVVMGAQAAVVRVVTEMVQVVPQVQVRIEVVMDETEEVQVKDRGRAKLAMDGMEEVQVRDRARGKLAMDETVEDPVRDRAQVVQVKNKARVAEAAEVRVKARVAAAAEVRVRIKVATIFQLRDKALGVHMDLIRVKIRVVEVVVVQVSRDRALAKGVMGVQIRDKVQLDVEKVMGVQIRDKVKVGVVAEGPDNRGKDRREVFGVAMEPQVRVKVQVDEVVDVRVWKVKGRAKPAMGVQVRLKVQVVEAEEGLVSRVRD